MSFVTMVDEITLESLTKEQFECFIEYYHENYPEDFKSDLENLEEIYKMMNGGVEYPRTQNASPSETKEPYEPSPRMYSYKQPSCLGSKFIGETLRKSDQLHQTFEKSSIEMTHDEPIGDPDTMEDKVDNPRQQCTPQVLPSIKLYTPPVTYLEEVEETIRIPMEVIFDKKKIRNFRKFHWMILRGRFNQLSHVSSSLLSKPGEEGKREAKDELIASDGLKESKIDDDGVLDVFRLDSRYGRIRTSMFGIKKMKLVELGIVDMSLMLHRVIVNGDAHALIASVSGGVEADIPPKTTTEKIARRNELKAKSTLLLAISDENLLKFRGIKDAKTLWEAIKSRFGGNKESKKMQKTILKQQYENFVGSRFKGLDKTYDRFQKLIRQLEIHDNKDLEQIDTNDLEKIDLKWQVVMLTMRVKRFIKKIGRNLNFNGKETVGSDKTKVECYNCQKRGHFATECRALRSQENKNGDNTRRVVPVETLANALVVTDRMGYDWSYQAEEGPIDFALMAFSSSGSSSSDTKDSQLNERGLSNKSDVFESAFDSSVNESEEDNNQINDKYKAGKGYHAVHPSYIGSFMPPRPDLSFARLDDSVFKSAISETVTMCMKLKQVHLRLNKPSHAKINLIKSNENSRKSVIEQHTYKQAENLRKSQNSRVNKRVWNGKMTQKLGDGFEFKKKACFVCGSLYHLIRGCNFYENKMVVKFVLNNKGKATGQKEVRPVWNNAKRVNHQNFSNNLTQPHPRRNFVPISVITNSGKVPVNIAKQSSLRATTSTSTARYVNTAANRPTVNVVSAVHGKKENAVKSSACWIWRPTENIIDHIFKDSGSYMLKRSNYVDLQGRLKSAIAWHITGNKSFLTDYQEIDGGFVAFGGSLKGGKISGKDHLGKFEGKADEGFLVGYFVNSKAFRVFNSRTRRVEENLHIKFLENKPNVAGKGPKWLFDIDSLTNSMNYELVTAGNQTNNDADDKDAGEIPDKGDEGVSKGSGIDDQEKTDRSTQDVDTAELNINTASINLNTSSLNINIVGSNDPSMPLVTDINKETKSKQNRTKPSTKRKAWKSQNSTKVNKKSTLTKSKPPSQKDELLTFTLTQQAQVLALSAKKHKEETLKIPE
nr:ribonuclease H-like domain-containing protein [Tanacetum cinerariifolium]